MVLLAERWLCQAYQLSKVQALHLREHGQACGVRSPVSQVFLHPPIGYMFSLQQKLGACFNCEGVSCQTLHHPPTLPEQRTQSDYECCCSRKGGAGVDAASSADRVL